MSKHPGRGDHAWRTIRTQVLAASNICINCGQPIDTTLSGRHPLGPSIDHRIPISRLRHLEPADQRAMALDPANLGPSHLRCNSRRGNRMSNKTAAPKPKSPVEQQSRQW